MRNPYNRPPYYGVKKSQMGLNSQQSKFRAISLQRTLWTSETHSLQVGWARISENAKYNIQTKYCLELTKYCKNYQFWGNVIRKRGFCFGSKDTSFHRPNGPRWLGYKRSFNRVRSHYLLTGFVRWWSIIDRSLSTYINH